MSGAASYVSMALSFATSMMETGEDAQSIHDMNIKNKARHEENKGYVAEMLGTLSERTSRAEFETNRSALRKKREIIKAAHAAEGEKTVRAAKLGTGAGKRASLATFKGISRVAGDMITDTNINLQTELTNLTENLNDKAYTAIRDLNRSIPEMGEIPGMGDAIIGATISMLGSSGAQSLLKDSFNSGDTDTDFGSDKSYGTDTYDLDYGGATN